MTIQANIPANRFNRAQYGEHSASAAIAPDALRIMTDTPVLLPDTSADLVHRDLLTPWQRRKVIQFVEERIASTIKIEELAALAKLGKSYFSRAFKTSFGQSPYAYILERRMDLAKELMANTQLALTEIALDCGMTDQAHLCKTFRKALGQTPNGWRRANRKAFNDGGRKIGGASGAIQMVM